jgi:colanic acid/amylovoran biosynthesis glycosyltransferase
VNLVVSQALAAGLPVITTRHSGLPEQVIDGSNGYVVDEADYRALAEAIIRLAEHPDVLPAFGEAGRAHVRRYYDSATLIDRQIELYRQLIDDASSAPAA